MNPVNRTPAGRRAVQDQNPAFFAAVSVAMFEIDPIGINRHFNTDEYDPDAGTVIPRLPACLSADDVSKVLLEEFQAWFGPETVGDISAYRALAERLWLLMERNNA